MFNQLLQLDDWPCSKGELLSSGEEQPRAPVHMRSLLAGKQLCRKGLWVLWSLVDTKLNLAS